MDWVQLHLALNHLPVVGVPLLTAMLLVAWALRRREVLRFTLWFLFVVGILSIGMKFTGDFAANGEGAHLAHLRDSVTLHEESGDQATTAVFLLVIATAVALVQGRGGRAIRSWALGIVLLFGIVSSLLYARSAHTGGLISHPEIRDSASGR